MKKALVSIASALILATIVSAQKPIRPPKYNIPDLNKRATVLIRPTIADMIVFEELDGKTISLRVIVDRNGNVESAAAAINFSTEVRAAAELAALESKFQAFVVKGKTERYFGSLQYSFAYEKMDWFAFGTALESVHNFDNLSVTPVAEKLTVRWSEERARLTDIDKLKDINERIKSIAAMIGHFRSKLEGRDRWLFSAAVVVRNATMWGMVGGKIDRNELQSAFEKIGPITENVPSEIPQEFVENLKELSQYKINTEMDERELRQEIMKLAMKLRNYPR